MNFLEHAQQLKENMIETRRYLHEHPEIGFDLPETYEYVWNKLLEFGIEPKACGPSGITAVIGENTEKTILLRADMDALPMKEESGLPFASQNGNAHACGHDMHTTMLLYAARILKEQEAALNGCVKFMFQPAEELIEGAKSMVSHGVLENPTVHAAIGAHMLPLAPSGTVLYNTGVVTASSDSFLVIIHGKGGHGAQPNLAIDPINIAAHIHLALQELISREADPEETVVVTVGSIQAGSAHNIIPETAVLKGTLRAYDEETRRFMLERIEQVCMHTAETFRGKAEVTYPAATGSVVVDSEIAEIAAAGILQELGANRIQRVDQRASGSEDFSEISARVPSLFFALGAGSKEEGYQYGLHNPKVRFDEESLPYGAAAYAAGAVAWLNNGEIRERAPEEVPVLPVISTAVATEPEEPAVQSSFPGEPYHVSKARQQEQFEPLVWRTF